MSEILVFGRNKTNPNSLEEDRGCYKRGMPVIAMPDGHLWGTKETLPDFIIIKIPGLSVDKANSFIKEQTEDDLGAPTINMYRRRRWHLVWANLPQAIKDEILSTGEYTTTVAKIRNYLKRIRDNVQFTGFD
jgi:hypothetical protein